jgi:Lon protease-like protein
MDQPATVMAMFPLGTPLLPGVGIPLHVFEPRYRRMVVDILAADGPPEFGQVLITHGLDSGGGDERADVGTIARMADIQALEDGRYVFVAVGTERIRVLEWLPDDPYPQARVERWPDADAGESLDLAAAGEHVRSALALAAELSGTAPPELPPLDDADRSAATYRLAAMAPIGAADQFALLAAAGPVERVAVLHRALDDVEAMLRFRLS